ncbi:hypothetical protein LEP1GSC038_3608 [Leptospira weilii str. 2006001855]|uniref:Uncharacterized protein n=1 Tax=Leptospira weilii str. 2006001855 TaxID=996804 RepID=M6FQ29_9LEPT|nr:hypothetical protein LEP1GSC038_3608 [Leptospira weilii str. 2006001855]
MDLKSVFENRLTRFYSIDWGKFYIVSMQGSWERILDLGTKGDYFFRIPVEN